MVAGYTQLLRRRYRDRLDQDANDFIDFAVDGVKRMQALINDLLAFSRVGTQGGPFERIDTSALLDDVITDLASAIEDTGTHVIRDALPVVFVDGRQLAQVFQNLIANAIKYRRDGVTPRVHVRVQRAGSEWRFEVEDNRLGIEPQYYERVFVLFQRLHTREHSDGTGIGLAISKKIVERHGGRIWLNSVPGAGSTFHFTLPAITPTP
jgi:light-regulated signal transduction histidine kinase (bacteriophytochrome)